VTLLHELVRTSARLTPDATSVCGPDRTVTYLELDTAADHLALTLRDSGVCQGDRVGIWFDKSVIAIVVMQAVLRLGAAYVPVDPLVPAARAAKLMADCEAKVLVTSAANARSVAGMEISASILCLDDEDTTLSEDVFRVPSAVPLPYVSVSDDDLAYILYTSGSTGSPKGVCISHRNAMSFVDWAATEIEANPADNFANHAPLNFDLSVLDLYVAFRAGSCVHLIPHDMSYSPKLLTDFIEDHQISVWYSVPAALILMIRSGGLLDLHATALRAVLFAGEPFPINPLRLLREHFTASRFINMYGPTETNVCTYYEVREISASQAIPVPIGSACAGNVVTAVKPDGTLAREGEEGELVVTGPTVMLGYWGQPVRINQPYATGDLVQVKEDGCFQYLGRLDTMVKVRGNRVELGEVEAVLAGHTDILEAVAVVVGHSIDARIVAFIVTANDYHPSLLEMKKLCAEVLPRHSIVDGVHEIPEIPRTRNGKVDRSALEEMAHRSSYA